MNCLSQVISCLSNALEQLGLYEPVIDSAEAKKRLSVEGELWQRCQVDRNQIWDDFQHRQSLYSPLPKLVGKAIEHFYNCNIQKGVAVDLGCGISTTAVTLLERGWKVYAVDSSFSVLNTLTQKISMMGKKWIEDGQLVLVNQAIEEYEYPEKVDLVTAIDSLPYCDPKKIEQIFCKAKHALRPQGVLVCSLFPYQDPCRDHMLRKIFGGWMTTKNVVEAVMRGVNFPSWSVTDGQSPGGFAKQCHVFAENI
jgi:SAM-dependent methyltransferase